jgi:hypothetical protein
MIQCPNCYAQNQDEATVCYNCRTPLSGIKATVPPPAYGYAGAGAVPMPMSPPTSPLAIVSLVASILGLIGILPLIGSVVGVVLGHIALNQIKARPNAVGGSGLAKAGLIIGYIGIALMVLVILLVCVFWLVAIVGAGVLGSTSY